MTVSKGDTIGDFKVTKAVNLPEIHCFLTELEHLPTGANVMHLGNDDPENLFCLSFQTTPNSSDGVAHILEHTVLCGSKKFPVKDPFFLMMRRSLNTFMNAFTGSDFTCYPAASQVEKDFYNLLDVYLDAVFHPFLHEESFCQEGHRFEFADPKDPNSPLEYRGIVYNEMKGAMATPSSRLINEVHAQLYPDITYGYNSGGEPKIIPQLTYEDLKGFHRKYYHPSRCLFFFYGDIPLKKHLDFIEKHSLQGVERVDSLPSIPRQPRFSEPKRVEQNYPVTDSGDSSEKSLISFGWLFCHVLDQEELLAMTIIEAALLGNDAAPLKKVLLRSGLCKHVSAYIEADHSEPPFIITLRGCEADNANSLEEVLRSKLEEIVKEGIPKELIDNVMHQIEFHRSEITNDHSPYGLTLFMHSGLLKQHGASPESGLQIHSLFEQIRADMAKDPKYLEGLIKKYLLDNTHFVRVTLKPDTELATKESEDEKKSLEEIKNKLSAEDSHAIIQKAEALASFQASQEDEDDSVLPKVELEDVPKISRDFPLHREKVGNLELFYHETFTNEIVYSDLVFPMPDFSEEELPYVKLYTALVTNIGCGERDYLEQLDYIQAHTGGIYAKMAINIQADDFDQFSPYFYIKGKALYRNADKLFPLMKEVVTNADLTDVDRLKEIILQKHTALEHSLVPSALRYAMNISASGLNVPSKVIYYWHGLGYLLTIRDLAQNFDEKKDEIVSTLQSIQKKMSFIGNPHLVLSCDRKMYEQLKSEQFYGLQDVKPESYTPWSGNYPLSPIEPQGRIIASPVSCVAKVFRTVPFSHPDSPGLCVTGHLLDNLTIHKLVREQGGAYGGGATNNEMSGNYFFYSYRDPNISKTMDAFEIAANRVANGTFDDSDLEEAKLETIQSFDHPISPGSQGHVAYSWYREGKTLESRQQFRNTLLALTKEDLISIVQKHIIPNLKTSVPVVFAGKELLEKENGVLSSQGKETLKIEPI